MGVRKAKAATKPEPPLFDFSMERRFEPGAYITNGNRFVKGRLYEVVERAGVDLVLEDCASGFRHRTTTKQVGGPGWRLVRTAPTVPDALDG